METRVRKNTDPAKKLDKSRHYHPWGSKRVEEETSRLEKKLKDLRDVDWFRSEVSSIREKFLGRKYVNGLPRSFGVTDVLDKKGKPLEKTLLEKTPWFIKDRERSRIEFSLLIDKPPAWVGKSRKNEFDRAILGLRSRCDLPHRFDRCLAHYLLFGAWMLTAMECSRVRFERRSGRDPQLFIEIYGDTALKDIQDSWSAIELEKKALGLPGSHLSKATNYYLAQTSLSKIQAELRGHSDKNVMKLRAKKISDRRSKNPYCNLPLSRCSVFGEHSHP